ncbi:hypothetical protein RJT34_02717 [Clitoria ternatea]|uniref:Uncharacterized protein n=1 Tax=Clitoria ternatea TaxID=43366 RepID=A0AAN9PZ52_CLITE
MEIGAESLLKIEHQCCGTRLRHTPMWWCSSEMKTRVAGLVEDTTGVRGAHWWTFMKMKKMADGKDEKKKKKKKKKKRVLMHAMNRATFLYDFTMIHDSEIVLCQPRSFEYRNKVHDERDAVRCRDVTSCHNHGCDSTI